MMILLPQQEVHQHWGLSGLQKSLRHLLRFPCLDRNVHRSTEVCGLLPPCVREVRGLMSMHTAG